MLVIFSCISTFASEAPWTADDVEDIAGIDDAASFGDVARASHRDTIQNGSNIYFGSSACLRGVHSDEAAGQRGSDCVSESFISPVGSSVLYNEDINRASVCLSSDEPDDQVTTQIFLITW